MSYNNKLKENMNFYLSLGNLVDVRDTFLKSQKKMNPINRKKKFLLFKAEQNYLIVYTIFENINFRSNVKSP